MSELSDFLAMGGHAPFVWGSYAAALIVLAGLGLLTWRRVRSTRDTLAKLEAARPRRRRERAAEAAPRAAAKESGSDRPSAAFPSPTRPVREATADDA